MLDVVISNFNSPVDTSIFPRGELRPLTGLCRLLHPHFRRAKDCKESLAVPACRLSAPPALFQHNGLENAHLIPRRYILLQSHCQCPSGNAQIHPVNVPYTRSSDQQWWTPECSESVKAKHRAWKQWRTLNNNSSRARYTRPCTTAKNCQLQAKSS